MKWICHEILLLNTYESMRPSERRMLDSTERYWWFHAAGCPWGSSGKRAGYRSQPLGNGTTAQLPGSTGTMAKHGETNFHSFSVILIFREIEGLAFFGLSLQCVDPSVFVLQDLSLQFSRGTCSTHEDQAIFGASHCLKSCQVTFLMPWRSSLSSSLELWHFAGHRAPATCHPNISKLQVSYLVTRWYKMVQVKLWMPVLAANNCKVDRSVVLVTLDQTWHHNSFVYVSYISLSLAVLCCSLRRRSNASDALSTLRKRWISGTPHRSFKTWLAHWKAYNAYLHSISQRPCSSRCCRWSWRWDGFAGELERRWFGQSGEAWENMGESRHWLLKMHQKSK